MLLDFDPLDQRYPSRRIPIYASNGMVCCSEPKAAAAGLEALRRGGNAVDAAVAAAACLTVTEPTSNGIGGDAFAIVWIEKDKRIYGLNSSGPAPKLASIERVLAEGRDEAGKMPRLGWTPVTVPGAPGAWAELVGRFGRRSLSEDLEHAAEYAEKGYPCSPVVARNWKKAFDLYREKLGEEGFRSWVGTFAPLGRSYRAGEMVCLPDHARTLREIGETGGESFYRGRLAEEIDRESRAAGGYLRAVDLAGFRPEWVDPIKVNYRGIDVLEIPPNGQGIAALMALNILKEFDLAGMSREEACHRKIEAMKMAFSDAFSMVTDPRCMADGWEYCLTPGYGSTRAKEMGEEARIYSSVMPPKSGTVYLAAADGEGNMVSYIQSNYNGFGSGVVVNGTGIALQNRGADFSLDPEAANCLMPGKRTYHTIIPGFLMKDGLPLGPFGVMGAYMQPQGHVQVVTGLIDEGLDPQQALDAPRWQWLRDGTVILEQGYDPDTAESLKKRGHDLTVTSDHGAFGKGQIILRMDNGVLVGGTEPRADSSIACW